MYRDSVTLMQISASISQRPGVRSALVAMATDLNLSLAAGMGFSLEADLTPSDLIVAIDAEDEATLAAARAAAEAALAERARATGATGQASDGVITPRTVASAASRLDDATLALISTPGRLAYLDAMDALTSGLSVMIFSDNVPVEQEVALKAEATRRGLLVMGPDCGTAVVSGVGLGFANVVRPGPVGLVAASGTGAQHVMALLDAAGVGISHCLGVGGRDLSAQVRGASTVAALDALDADPATELILVISKPPADEVADAIRAHAATLSTPVQFALLGADQPDLTEATAEVLRALGRPVPDWPVWGQTSDQPTGRFLRGLFCGGTLCDEAMVILSERLGPIFSNIPLRPEWALPAFDSFGTDVALTGHYCVDFGDDRFTTGRPHPMMDGSLRRERLAIEAADPEVGVILLDVVLGHGAHPDPAAELAPAIADAHATAARDGRQLSVVVSLTGTAGDPQGRDRQAEALAKAGAVVFASNAAAAQHAATLVASRTSSVSAEIEGAGR